MRSEIKDQRSILQSMEEVRTFALPAAVVSLQFAPLCFDELWAITGEHWLILLTLYSPLDCLLISRWICVLLCEKKLGQKRFQTSVKPINIQRVDCRHGRNLYPSCVHKWRASLHGRWCGEGHETDTVQGWSISCHWVSIAGTWFELYEFEL